MLIQHQALSQHLKGKIAPIYVLVGPDSYFIDEQAKAIKQAFKSQHDADVKILSILAADDWKLFIEEANSYTLFASHQLIDLRYDKKTLDSPGKKTLEHYLENVNEQCLVLLRTPNIPAKQLQWLAAKDKVVLVTAYSLPAPALKTWINKQLQRNQFQFDHSVIELIFHNVQGNMLACAQAIEKIDLSHAPGAQLNAKDLLEQLSDQSAFQLYDLTEACLAGQVEKAISVTRKLLLNPAEYSLVLWLLTQEIRTLIQLKDIEQSAGFSKACEQLRIWKQRTGLYQKASKRLSVKLLQQLLLSAFEIDNAIKSGTGASIKHLFEKVVLLLCRGEK